ncbi:MAG: hypothetical protein ACT4P6_08805 [Gemmatimonadaceae bacterium]
MRRPLRVIPLVVIVVGPRTIAAQPALERVASVRVTGVVFVDRNGNGVREPGEAGLAGVAVSDQMTVTVTDNAGRFTIDAAGYGVVFVTQPNGYAVRGPFWRRAEVGRELGFAMTPLRTQTSFTFIHASDTHISAESVPRVRGLKALVDSLRPAFLLMALRGNEWVISGSSGRR